LGVAREEHLYLLSPQGRDDLALMVTVTLPVERPGVVLTEVERFFELLKQLYSTMGGPTPLRAERLREARLGTPRLALSSELDERADIPLEKFVAAFSGWIEVQRQSFQ
jgi:hypothetical protein